MEPFVTKERYEAAIKPCMDLAISRNLKYGNSIDMMRNGSIIDLILMKLTRNRELPEDDPKYEDELQDCLNYLTYILMRRNK